MFIKHVWFKLTEKEKQLQEERRKLLEKKNLEDQEKKKNQGTGNVFYMCVVYVLPLTGKGVKQAIDRTLVVWYLFVFYILCTDWSWQKEFER